MTLTAAGAGPHRDARQARWRLTRAGIVNMCQYENEVRHIDVDEVAARQRRLAEAEQQLQTPERELAASATVAATRRGDGIGHLSASRTGWREQAEGWMTELDRMTSAVNSASTTYRLQLTDVPDLDDEELIVNQLLTAIANSDETDAPGGTR